MADEAMADDRPGGLSRNGWLLVAGLFPVVALEIYSQRPLWGPTTVLAVVNLATMVTFMVTGLLLKDEPGQHGTGWALILAGIVHPLGMLNRWDFGPMPLYAAVFGYLDDIFGAWALLRYPNPRLARHQRVFLTIMCCWLIGGPAFLAVASKPSWEGASTAAWWPAWFPDRSVYNTSSGIFDLGALVLALVFVVLLLSRFFRAKGMDRIVITPVIVAAVVSDLAAGAVVTGLLVSANGDTLLTVESAVELVVPVAFLISVIQRRIARGRIADLAVQLATPDPAKPVRDALRKALHDPQLDICYWMPASRAYVDGAGRPADPGHPGPGQLAIPMTGSDGVTPLAVLFADHSTVSDGPLLKGALSASRMALENARLQADLQAQLQETKASRARIMEASLAERRKLERNLHDGAQQHLLGLAARLGAIKVKAKDPDVIASMDHISAEILEVLGELRALAQGILPPVLEQSGIGAAVEGVIERLHLPVRLQACTGRLPPAIEATAYFVVSEALANTVKHAQAHSADVRICRADEVLIVEVSDDGRGGADAAGTGLSALADRVASLGGQFGVTSTQGEGTRLTARIPCG